MQSVQAEQPQQAGEAPRSLLTAHEVQGMLGIDRSTVYRMAEDGRLPAIKVGRQWRFPADRLQQALTGEPAGRAFAPAVLPEPGPDHETADVVTSVAADLLGVMMVVTDMHGQPVSAVANPCPWFAERADDADILAACTEEWQALADDVDLQPRFREGALGFECARAFIRSGTSLVGMVLAGGVAPIGKRPLGLYALDDDQRRHVIAKLPTVAAALSRSVPRARPPL